MKITNLEDLLTDELKDLYSAETQLIKTLPKLARAAESDELRTAFEEHLEKTRGHAQRLEEISHDLSIKPRGKKCLGMEGLIKEGQELLAEEVHQPALEAGLIGAAQRVEHYEIAAYGTAAAHAQQLGYLKAVDLLCQTLAEEKEADLRLTTIAQNRANVKAAGSEALTTGLEMVGEARAASSGATNGGAPNGGTPKGGASSGVSKEDTDRWKDDGGAR